MEFIRKLYYFLTPYTDAREQTVALFFKGLREHHNRSQTRARLSSLLQQDIAVINLWTEYQYKGYKYLHKSERKKLYANLQLITDDFSQFYTAYTPVAPPKHIAGDPQKIALIQTLMAYFSPHRGTYEYRKSSSFGRLLRNPAREKLVGDCNQIVTLYIYLYSRYYDVGDLQIRLTPGHVSLYYGGVDVETTNSTFADYSKQKDAKLLPVEEIVSVNLLDTTDAYLATHEVAAEDFLQASRLAYILSYDRDIVASNLNSAYSKMVNSLMERHNYKRALEFASASRNLKLLEVVGHNGALHEVKRHKYTTARRFAKYAPERETLIRHIWQAEGSYHYQAQRYQDAIKAFKHAGSQASMGRSFEALFFAEQKKLGPTMTTESIKKHSGTISRMRTYAKKSGNKQLIEHVKDLQKHL